MVDRLSLAKAMGAMSTLQGTPYGSCTCRGVRRRRPSNARFEGLLPLKAKDGNGSLLAGCKTRSAWSSRDEGL